MKDLNVLIVGGGSGLGALTAQFCVRDGALGVGIMDVNGDSATVVTNTLEGVATCAVEADISTRNSVEAGFLEVVKNLGVIDVVINCAAIYPRKPILSISDEDWDLSNGINIKGTYHVMVASIQHMREQPIKNKVRGRIVNISSVDAFKAHPQNAHYAATKAAVVSLTKSFAAEVASDNILINSVAPAGMSTEKAKASGIVQELAQASPLGRGAEVEEIAEWVMMAAGTKNTFMTGENIIVSGGYIYA